MTKQKNNKTKEFLYSLSSILILIASGSYIFNPVVAKYTMILGTIGFVIITFTTPYPGKSLRGKRLHNIHIWGTFFMVIGACLMFLERNEWIISLLISGVLICYSSILLSIVYKKEQEDSDHNAKRGNN